MKKIYLAFFSTLFYTYAISQNTIKTDDSRPKEYKTILGYLYVFPETLGTFDSYPETMVQQINLNNAYGRNDWRLPNKEELAVLENNHIDGASYEPVFFWNGGCRCTWYKGRFDMPTNDCGNCHKPKDKYLILVATDK